MKNILVAVDFSSLTPKLIEEAKKLAAKFDSKIWLVHIASPDPDFVGYDVGPQYIRDSRASTLRTEHRDLQQYAQAIEQEGFDVEPLLIQGQTAATIVEEAGKLVADLIVMGAEDHGKIFEKMFGSVWEDVVRKAKVPVLIVPGN
ncbi:MAG: universal stress protein [Lewinellaceae bacterium]|nr:universal stress protein [Lewinellaceae bacterium]